MRGVSRRDLITNAGMAVGGAVAGSVLVAGCNNDAQAAGPQVADFPYKKHIPSGFVFDKAAIQEESYHLFYVGGCGHGAFKSIMQHLADKVGAPFNLLAMDQAIYMGGGIAGYGSICGGINGAILAINMIVEEASVRSAMITDLIRWYEGNAFPAYVPATVDAAEAGKPTLDFSAANIVHLQITPQSHLCHASRSQWSSHNGVPAAGPDLSARCGRLTADVTGKAVDLLTSYLATGTHTAAAIDSVSAGCLTCHTPATTTHPVAAAMRCDSCHGDKVAGHP